MHCTQLVRQLAREGRIDPSQFACALHPVFALEPDSVEAVYGSPECRSSALAVLRNQLGGGSAERDLEATRYAATLLHLERKLRRQEAVVATLREGLEAASRQLEHFEPTHENVVAHLADLYGRTISNLKPRIMVQGDSHLLENTAIANRIRALLLAGIRSAVLWRQCGGTRLKLILGRNRLIEAANSADPL